jgi:3-hydroxyisobutyrate dehydrogenase
VFIDHTTVSAYIARQISVEARDLQVHCVDAPMTGSQIGAESGTLTLMCGGRKDAIEAARPVMEAYSRKIVHIGKAGAGQTAKMANQICIAGIVAGLAEAVRFAQASHLDMDQVYEAISGGAAQSWQMDNRWSTMASDEFDFGFAIDWMRKDLGLAMDEGRGLGVSLPITALVNQFYAEVQAIGGGRQDTSALIRRCRSGGETDGEPQAAGDSSGSSSGALASSPRARRFSVIRMISNDPSNSSISGTASISCEMTSGGVAIAASTKIATMT